MCLQTITGEPKKKSGYGYKIFERDSPFEPRSLASPVVGTPILTGVWNKAKHGFYRDARRTIILTNANKKYPIGFHIFLTLTDARKHWIIKDRDNGDYKIVRVRYRKAHTEGTECADGFDGNEKVKIIVAGEMFVPKNWKKVKR